MALDFGSGALLAGYGSDDADRAAIVIDGVGLNMAAQTAAAVISRPELQPLAQRRLDWLRHRLS